MESRLEILPDHVQVSCTGQFDGAEAGAERLRMAFLVGPENFFTKTFEDTATNRGLAVRSTTSLAEARAFLGLKDS